MKNKIAKSLLILAKELLSDDGSEVEEIKEIEPQGSKPIKERRQEASEDRVKDVAGEILRIARQFIGNSNLSKSVLDYVEGNIEKSSYTKDNNMKQLVFDLGKGMSSGYSNTTSNKNNYFYIQHYLDGHRIYEKENVAGTSSYTLNFTKSGGLMVEVKVMFWRQNNDKLIFEDKRSFQFSKNKKVKDIVKTVDGFISSKIEKKIMPYDFSPPEEPYWW